MDEWTGIADEDHLRQLTARLRRRHPGPARRARLRSGMTDAGLSDEDLAVDHELADIAASFRFLLDLTPIDLAGARRAFDADGRPPQFRYRAARGRPGAWSTKRLDASPSTRSPTLPSPASSSPSSASCGSRSRCSAVETRPTSCRSASSSTARSARRCSARPRTILDDVAPPGPDRRAVARCVGLRRRRADRARPLPVAGPRHRVARRGARGQHRGDGLERRRAHRADGPVRRVAGRRAAPARGRHPRRHPRQRRQPAAPRPRQRPGRPRRDAGGAGRARRAPRRRAHGRDGCASWPARVVAVHEMVEGAGFDDVHGDLVDGGMSSGEAFSITDARVPIRRPHQGRRLPPRPPRARRPPRERRRASSRSGSGSCPSRRRPLVADLHHRGALQRPAPAAPLPRGRRRTAAPRSPTPGHVADLTDRRHRMRIGFVVNSVATEKPEYTTTRLALAATRRGHETWLIGVDDFSHRPDGTVAAHAHGRTRQEALERPRLPRERAGRRPEHRADQRRRARRARHAQRPRGRPRRAPVGRHLGDPVRPARRWPGAPSWSTTRRASPTPSTRPTSSTSRTWSDPAR